MTARLVSLRGGLHAELVHLDEGDAPATLAYFHRVSRETDFLGFGAGEYPRSVEEEAQSWRAFSDPAKGLALAARIDGELAGILTLSRPRLPRVQHAGQLGISVLKQYWGVGLGRALCEQGIVEARQIGISRIELHTRQDNHRAIALYEALGFEHEGRLRGAYRIGAVEYDDVVMGLRLHA
jgi:RimJ/RimL family protein N-acetyltransferase